MRSESEIRADIIAATPDPGHPAGYQIDGIDVEAGSPGDEWAVQTYQPLLPRGVSRRAVRTYGTRARAERAAAKWRGLGPTYNAWVRDLTDPDGGWR